MRNIAQLFVLACMIILTGCAGTMPDNLGVTDGKLLPCPESPNCVSSDAPASDDQHHVQPLALVGSPEESWRKLLQVINDHCRTELITQDNNYIHATYTSRIFRFVDDVEFHLRPEQENIAVRSASRLGYSDLGANRDRVEFIREKMAE